jgi:hypothetical protein
MGTIGILVVGFEMTGNLQREMTPEIAAEPLRAIHIAWIY